MESNTGETTILDGQEEAPIRQKLVAAAYIAGIVLANKQALQPVFSAEGVTEEKTNELLHKGASKLLSDLETLVINTLGDKDKSIDIDKSEQLLLGLFGWVEVEVREPVNNHGFTFGFSPTDAGYRVVNTLWILQGLPSLEERRRQYELPQNEAVFE